MNGKHTFSLFLGLAALAAIALIMSPRALLARQDPSAAMEEKAKEQAPTTKPAGCEMCNMGMKQLETMAKVRELLTEAKGSAQTAGATDAVSKIEEALKMIEKCHQHMHAMMKEHMHMMHRGMMGRRMMGKGEEEKMAEMKCPMCGKMMAEEPKVVNSACPITGKKIDPYDVPDNLIREFRGEKVGFCSPNCPPAWDKLSDAEKQAKLDAVMKPSKPAKAAEHHEHHGG